MYTSFQITPSTCFLLPKFKKKTWVACFVALLTKSLSFYPCRDSIHCAFSASTIIEKRQYAVWYTTCSSCKTKIFLQESGDVIHYLHYPGVILDDESTDMCSILFANSMKYCYLFQACIGNDDVEFHWVSTSRLGNSPTYFGWTPSSIYNGINCWRTCVFACIRFRTPEVAKMFCK